MSFLESAIALAQAGFHVFPLHADTKDRPLITDFPHRATRDLDQIKKWWTDPVLGVEKPYNIGISTTCFGDNEALVVVDIDVKEDKNGYDTALRLELEGKALPPTFSQSTPSGGAHLIFRRARPVRQGVSVLGPGLDVRSRGGYIVGLGSEVQGRAYALSSGSLCEAPGECPRWVSDICGEAADDEPLTALMDGEINFEYALERAEFYLEHEALPSIEHQGGNHNAFRVAARCKDLGLDEFTTHKAMLDFWNERCDPPWAPDELEKIVQNAFRYGDKPQGADAPEKQFTNLDEPKKRTLHPFEKLNQKYAFVMTGGGHHILHETTDEKGRFRLEHWKEQSFHALHASDLMENGGKMKPLTELWMKSSLRRTYHGMCFRPGQEVDKRFYNLWRGFSVAPSAPGSGEAHESVRAFLEHARQNVCGNDEALFRWLIGYFAHIIQKPYEKPLTALVFRGRKGTGKNALIERVGALFRDSYFSTADRRYLIGNFNSHLENCLVLTLNEAFWSGDKAADGILKSLVTETDHLIERKGQEPYKIENITRVVVIGNERWLVPATEDERRYAVFDVTDGRRQDKAFFRDMRIGMEQGGYSHLLRYLMDFDLSTVDVNDAPATAGLHEQKIATLEPFQEWWYQCLTEGEVTGSGEEEWPADIPKAHFREAFYSYAKSRGVKGRLPDERMIGRQFATVCKSADRGRKVRDGSSTRWVYQLPPLEQCRKDWEAYIGHKTDWGKV